MDDTISRQAAIDATELLIKDFRKDAVDVMNFGHNYNHGVADAIATLKHLPSAKRRGRWIKHPWGGGVHTCSVCGERAEIVLRNGYITGDASPSGETGGYYHYDRCELLSNNCPNCGARMERE